VEIFLKFIKKTAPQKIKFLKKEKVKKKKYKVIINPLSVMRGNKQKTGG